MDYLGREVRRLSENGARSEEEQRRFATYQSWETTKDHAKIVLGASDQEFEQVKLENPLHFLVIDLGYTQVEPNTETCLALWPMRMSARSPILTKLRPL
jgi:peptidyl-tRNA hydrolase